MVSMVLAFHRVGFKWQVLAWASMVSMLMNALLLLEYGWPLSPAAPSPEPAPAPAPAPAGPQTPAEEPTWYEIKPTTHPTKVPTVKSQLSTSSGGGGGGGGGPKTGMDVSLLTQILPMVNTIDDMMPSDPAVSESTVPERENTAPVLLTPIKNMTPGREVPVVEREPLPPSSKSAPVQPAPKIRYSTTPSPPNWLTKLYNEIPDGRKEKNKHGEQNWWLSKAPPTVRCTASEPQSDSSRECTIRLPEGRDLPETMCPLSKVRIMMLSFFTVSPHGQLWKSAGSKDGLGVRNRHCFAATRKYIYVVEVVNDSDLKVAVQYYKPWLVKQYLELTDWLVFLDYDLIVKHPYNWYEQYIDASNYDLIVTDHKEDINNGAFMLRNSKWGRAFARHWLDLSSDRDTYPFSDNGPFAETVLRFGTRLKKPECRHKFNVCVKDVQEKGAARMKGAAWLHCLGRIKEAVMGPWERNTTRTMGRVKFASTAGGFNSHSWEKWKAKSGRTSDTYFRDGQFVLHNKYFSERVPKTSIACPMALASYPFNKQGAYALSDQGVCSLDDQQCRKKHFREACTEKKLKLVTNEGINARKALLHGTVANPPVLPMTITELDDGGGSVEEECPANNKKKGRNGAES